MTTIIYTALRNLTGITAINSLATLEVGISDYSRSRAVVKDVQRAKGGTRETLYHRTDITHQITFQPVNGFLATQMLEFLSSTESGEQFTLYIYGNESLPLTVVREDDGHSDVMFMGVGNKDQDYFQASITVMEV
jgi:hypothetical protein